MSPERPEPLVTDDLLDRAAGSDPAPPAWARLVGVFDLETTGVDVRTDRIVTAHVGTLGADGAVLSARSWLADPGVAIPEGATAVHGISTGHARAHGRPAAEVVGEVVEALSALFDTGIAVVAFNAPYDLSLLRNEALRHGVEPIARPEPVIDPLVVDKGVDRYRRGKRTLDLVAAHYGVPLDGAHDAAADAVAAGRVALALAARYADALPATASGLHARQVDWAREQAAGLTDYLVRVGRLGPAETVDGAWPIR